MKGKDLHNISIKTLISIIFNIELKNKVDEKK